MALQAFVPLPLRPAVRRRSACPPLPAPRLHRVQRRVLALQMSPGSLRRVNAFEMLASGLDISALFEVGGVGPGEVGAHAPPAVAGRVLWVLWMPCGDSWLGACRLTDS